jgi:hypothetical protein
MLCGAGTETPFKCNIIQEDTRQQWQMPRSYGWGSCRLWLQTAEPRPELRVYYHCRAGIWSSFHPWRHIRQPLSLRFPVHENCCQRIASHLPDREPGARNGQPLHYCLTVHQVRKAPIEWNACIETGWSDTRRRLTQLSAKASTQARSI